MIYTLNPALGEKLSVRLLGIFGFALLTGIGAQISVPWEPVPFSLQVLFVLLAGLTLGARDGFSSQVTYLSLILIGLPLAAEGYAGLAAFSRPSTGYLYSFPIAAGLVGLLAVRDVLWMRLLACLVGIVVIYAMGASYLKQYLDATWEQAWAWGVAPFIVADLLKAVVATSGGEITRQWWLRQYPPQ